METITAISIIPTNTTIIMTIHRLLGGTQQLNELHQDKHRELLLQHEQLDQHREGLQQPLDLPIIGLQLKIIIITIKISSIARKIKTRTNKEIKIKTNKGINIKISRVTKIINSSIISKIKFSIHKIIKTISIHSKTNNQINTV